LFGLENPKEGRKMRIAKTYGRIKGKASDCTRLGGDEIEAQVNTKDFCVQTFLDKYNSGLIVIRKCHMEQELDDKGKPIEAPHMVMDEIIKQIPFDCADLYEQRG